MTQKWISICSEAMTSISPFAQAKAIPASDPAGFAYGNDDFIFWDMNNNPTTPGTWIGVGTVSLATWQTDHPGIITFPSGTGGSLNQIVGNMGSPINSVPPPLFSTLEKAVVRFVVICDALFDSNSFNGEWYVGFANVSGSSVFGGALLSYAPGFTWTGPGGVPTPTPGLVCGSYTGQNISEITETTATNFPAIVPNTWYDLIISWTPTAINYYGAQYGTPPVLIGTHSAATPGGPNIYTGGQYLHASNNMYTSGPNVNLYIDMVEWLFKTSETGRLLESNLLNF